MTDYTANPATTTTIPIGKGVLAPPDAKTVIGISSTPITPKRYLNVGGTATPIQ